MATETAPLIVPNGDAPKGNGVHATASASASEKTLLVLEAALTHSRFTEVVAATGLAKATTHRILSTLVERQFVALAADGSYLPGPKILALAGRALARIDISAIARPFVDDLVAASRCTVHLDAVNGDEIVYLIRADSDRPYVMPSRVGLSVPMHCTGVGKVALADRSDDDLARFVARAGLAPRTEHTITTLPELMEELAAVRADGYAVDREEFDEDFCCVAAPVLGDRGALRGIIGLSASTRAFDAEHEELAAAAREVALQAGSHRAEVLA